MPTEAAHPAHAYMQAIVIIIMLFLEDHKRRWVQRKGDELKWGEGDGV